MIDLPSAISGALPCWEKALHVRDATDFKTLKQSKILTRRVNFNIISHSNAFKKIKTTHLIRKRD